MPLILGANSVSGYTVKNSLRFEASSSDYLSRTQGTPTSNQKFTVSTWYKRTKLDVVGDWWSIGSSGDTEYVNMKFDGANKLIVVLNDASSYYLFSNSLYRDVSAWYHVMLSVDTTQATASNRARVYVNGSEITSWGTSTYPTQNYTFPSLASGKSIFVGNRVADSNEPLRGYLADYYFIDGQQLTPTSFGETDTLSGIWIPKSYSGTYGTNGFYLQFKNSASLGTDSSGNGNTFTVNNLTSIDQTTDTPTNNFCTLNPLNNGGLTITEGNTKATGVGTHYAITSTMAVDKGKWYWEVKNGTDAGGNAFGVMGTEAKLSDQLNSTPSIWTRSSGNKFKDSVDGGAYMSFVNGDIIGVALDMDNGTIIFYKNGTSQGTAYSSINNGTVYSPALKFNTSGDNATINFGNPSYSANSYTDGAGYGNFSYAVPSGYYSLNTKNLANFG